MAEPSTLQRVFSVLEEAFRPLSEATTPDRASALLAELGVDATAAQADGLASRLQIAGAAAEGLLDDVSDLTTALDAGDLAQITARSASAIERIGAVVQAIEGLPTALAGLGLPVALQSDFDNRLFNNLLAKQLDSTAVLAEGLALLGVLDRQAENFDLGDPQVPPHLVSSFEFTRLGDWLDSPVAAAGLEYGWGTGGLDAEELLTRLSTLLLRFVPQAFIDPTTPTTVLDAGFFEIRPRPNINPPGLELELRQTIPANPIQLGGTDFTAILDPKVELPFGLRVRLRPPFDLDASVQGASLPAGEVRFEFAVDRSGAAEPLTLFGNPDASHLTVRRFGLDASTRFSGSAVIPTFRLELAEGKLAIDTAQADGFIRKILDGVKLETDFDLGIAVSATQGVFFEGSSSLDIQLPVHASLGPVDVSAVTVGLGIDGARFPVTLGADLKAELGPMIAVVRQLGTRAIFEFRDQRDGNAGPLDIRFEFKPPTGVGLSIDAGAVKGGGLLDIDAARGEYAGMMQLRILDLVTVTAIGVINTKLPDGSEGFSFVAIISVEFNPGIQLGFGFTLIGVGGLVGQHRTMDLEALRNGARSGSIDTILFPRDIIANATRILSDIRSFFPPEEGTFLIGPMTKFGWGTPTLVSLSLGIIIEVPGNIAIVGKLTVAIPDERVPLIIINVAFIGAIEFDKKRGWFRAILYDSRVIYMPLEGGMGVLAAFGSDPNFVVTVGGFHPRYDPPNLPFPGVPRIAISILDSPGARITISCYFAVTSNTAQFGARASVFFGFKRAGVEGHIGFDALFQFSPFYFAIDFNASLSVKVLRRGVFSVNFQGTLEGTSPWHVKGYGSIGFLFWDIELPIEHTWGDREERRLPPISVMPILVNEFEKVENWVARLDKANSLRVSLRTIDSATELVLHPLGSLAITQRAVPLSLTLDKFGSQRPQDANRFSIDAATDGIEKRGSISESFAIGQFKDFTDNQRLDAADYEKEEAGLELSVVGNQTRTSFMTKRIARYETIIIDSNFLQLFLGIVSLVGGLFSHFLGANAVARSRVSVRSRDRKHLFDDKVVVAPNAYVVANLADNTALSEAPPSFTSRASAQEYLARAAKTDPDLADRAHILRAHEVRKAA